MLYEREVLSEILANFSQKEIVLITGARQTGKTTILKQLEKETQNQKKATYFLNLENLEFVRLLNQSPENLFKIFPLDKKATKKSFIFIDEIQYLDNPTNFLKYIYDEYADIIKLVVSGSSAFYIDKKFKDSLVGRKRIFQLNTLNLRDFLIFKERSDILSHLPLEFSAENVSLLKKFPLALKKDLEALLEELIIYGGYPRVVLAKGPPEKKVILEEIATTYVKKDILETDIKEGEKFYDLFKILSSQVGQQINTNELANTLNLARPTVDHYLYLMRKSFHLALIKPFSRNMRKEITKMPKGYFYDVGLRNYFINNFNSLGTRQDPGQLLENFVFKQLIDKLKIDDIHYWRTTRGEEVDFIIQEKIAFEVKYRSNSFIRNKYTGFLKQYQNIPLHLNSYIIVDKDQDKTWPVWIF